MNDAPRLTQAEIADRITILGLKARHGFDVESEMARMQRHCIVPWDLVEPLRRANKECWDAMQGMIDHFEGRAVLPDLELIAVVRGGYFSNKERVRLKNVISETVGEQQELKSWER